MYQFQCYFESSPIKFKLINYRLFFQLDRYAQNWSDQLLSTRVLKHRPSSKFGENLWVGSNFTIDDLMTGKANPVSSWYAEISNYPSASFEKYGEKLI